MEFDPQASLAAPCPTAALVAVILGETEAQTPCMGRRS